MIQVLICDDQAVVCEGLRAILSTAPGVNVVGVAADGEQALQKAATLQPDLVLMDLKMPILNGIQATRRIRERFPSIKVLVLTNYGPDEWVLDALRAGAAGYLLKDSPRAELISAIEGAMAGKPEIGPAEAGKPPQPASQPHAPFPPGPT